MGFVPMEKLSATRTAIVGLAPLFAGCLALLLIGRLGLRLGPAGAALTANDWQALVDGLKEVARAPSVWVWAYLTFAISNTMFPSRSDLRAWPVLLFGLIALIGAVAWMWSSLSAPLAGALRWFSVACGLTALVDLPFALIILLTEKGLERLKGMKIEYR